jgi:hypothetical protein
VKRGEHQSSDVRNLTAFIYPERTLVPHSSSFVWMQLGFASMEPFVWRVVR